MKFIKNNFISLCALTFQVLIILPSNIKLHNKIDEINKKIEK